MAISIKDNRIFLLNTKEMSYVFDITDNGILRHLYWGDKIEHIMDFEKIKYRGDSGYHTFADQTMEEFSSFGMMRYKETSLKVTFCDGVRDFRYIVCGYNTKENYLEIQLKDQYYPFEVTLYYELFEEENIIKRWCSVKNTGEDKVVLERVYSAELPVAGCNYEIINYNGAWGAEFRQHSEHVNAGKKVFESLRGSTAHVSTPGFVVHTNATEDSGQVYYGVLEYSGNFKITAEATPYGYLNILIGMSDTDFAWVLDRGQQLSTPAAYCGYSNSGFTKMSQTLHHFSIEKLAPKAFAKKPHRVLYNSWYATLFDVDCDNQMELAKKAAKLGVELFIVDDGWFGERDDDLRSLGDWHVDKRKFPNGLNPLIECVQNEGMGFGIWVEPEMINENSRLYREHPDWVHRFPNREILKGRNQYVLNLAKDEVAAFIVQVLDGLLSAHNISYIKWDMNRAIGETSVDSDNSDKRKEVWKKHMDNFYKVIEEIRRLHPEVEFEACAAGGGRVDYGAMRCFDEYWPSDNADALDRLEIQEGYSLLYPIKYMRSWVIDSPDGFTKRKIPMSFRLHSAMCGVLGIGNNLNKLGAEDVSLLKAGIVQYKQIREVIQFGKLYRLKSLKQDEIQSLQYEKDGKSVLFAFLVNGRFGKEIYNVRLKGLIAAKRYSVKICGEELFKSGAFLMYFGLDISLAGDYDSVIAEIQCLEEGLG